MLTKDLAIFEYNRGVFESDRLRRETHADYTDRARRMLDIYRTGTGRRRGELHSEIEECFADDSHFHPKRGEAFCKLLDDVSAFHRSEQSAGRRTRVFLAAAVDYPLVEDPRGLFGQSRKEFTERYSARQGMPWERIEDSLFDDVARFQRLSSFKGYSSPEELLARYNVAQAQALLFDAIEITVKARRDFKEILRYAKLASLMHEIETKPDGSYIFRLSGAASVLHETRRYGYMMAKFIPGLLSCRDWELSARIQHRRLAGTFWLSSEGKHRLSGPVAPPSDFDSQLEESFLKKWGSEAREGWTIAREAEVFVRYQRVFTPDFTFSHSNGTKVRLEIVGFWTLEYLKKKRETLLEFADEPLMVAVHEKGRAMLEGVAQPVITYKTRLSLEPVLAALRNWLPLRGSAMGNSSDAA